MLGRGDEFPKEVPLELVVVDAVPLFCQPIGQEDEDVLRERGEDVVGHAGANTWSIVICYLEQDTKLSTQVMHTKVNWPTWIF